MLRESPQSPVSIRSASTPKKRSHYLSVVSRLPEMKRAISTLLWLAEAFPVSSPSIFNNNGMCGQGLLQTILLASLQLFIICKNRRSSLSCTMKAPRNMARPANTLPRWIWRPISISPKRSASFFGYISSLFLPSPLQSPYFLLSHGILLRDSWPLITIIMLIK